MALTEQETSLKDKTAKGLWWGGFGSALQQILNLVFGIFLARLLTPADYGLIGMLTIFSLMASTLQESGFTAALVNKKDISQRDYNAVFWFSIGMGASLYAILYFCAPLIADFYQIPQLVPLARYVFLGFLFSSFGVAQNAYLYKGLQVKKRTLSNVIALTLSGIIGVWMAWRGFAYWGIATQTLSYCAINTVCYWFFSPWRPSWSIDLSPLRGMIGFSSRILATNIIQNVNFNILNVIFGKYYNANEVGYYTQASKWSSMGHFLILSMVNGVAQPMFAKMQDDKERIRRALSKIMQFTAMASFPVMFGIGLVAPELIEIAITSKWLPSVPLLRLIAIAGAFIPLCAVFSNLIVSRGKSRIVMWSTLSLSILIISCALCLHPWGLMAMLASYVALQCAWLFVWEYFVWREVGFRLWRLVLDVLPFGVIAAAAMIATHYITAPMADIYVRFGCKIAIGALLYISILWICRFPIFMEALTYIKRKI